MAATQWGPAPYLKKQDWLLGDGTIATSPDLEQSSSGRRVRVVGTTESFGNRQVDTLIYQAIQNEAAKRGTTVAGRLWPDADVAAHSAAIANISDDVFTEALTLHALDEQHRSGRSNGKTTAFWKFERTDVPLSAYVFLTLSQSYSDRMTLTAKAVWQNASPDVSSTLSLIKHEDDYFTTNDNTVHRYSPEHDRMVEAVAKNPIVDDPDFRWETQQYPNQIRSAIVKFADQARRFNGNEIVRLPDTSGTMHEYKFVSTNYNAAFHSQLMDFVQTGPTLERIEENYKQMLKDLKALGLVVTSQINGGQIAEALASRDMTKINVTVNTNEDSDAVNQDGIDPYHTVTFDFATGTVVVHCAHNNDLNETAEAWNIAKFKAEIAGETDTLLAYAKAYQGPKEKKRLKKIVDQRTVDETE